MTVNDTVPKNGPYPPKPTETSTAVGPIAFDLAPTKSDDITKLPKIAYTHHSDENVAEIIPAELALIKPSAESKGVVLGLKLKMSPSQHTPPNKLTLPLVIVPEGGGIHDPKNSRWITVEVDLNTIYTTKESK